jgi:CheY-like chemotaxis protein
VRILLVDDYRDAVEALALWLRLQGHAVFTAATGMEALVFASSIDLSMAMLEFRLPDMRGDQLAAMLRELCPGMFIAALSGYPPTYLPKEAVAAFDCYWTKPVDVEHLRVFLEPARAMPAG